MLVSTIYLCSCTGSRKSCFVGLFLLLAFRFVLVVIATSSEICCHENHYIKQEANDKHRPLFICAVNCFTSFIGMCWLS